MKKLPQLLADPSAVSSEQDIPRSSSIAKKYTGSAVSPALNYILEEVRRDICSKRTRTPFSDREEFSKEQYEEIITHVADRLGLGLATYERDQIASCLESDVRAFGVIQKLVDDPMVSDIIVTDYSTISVQQGQQTFTTDLSFSSEAAYEAFVERLLLRAGSSYSTKIPVADGMIGENIRLHALHKCICNTGPYLTLRINRFSSVTARDLVDLALAPTEIMNYLRRIVRAGRTILIVGEVGTGKTTLARALASSIPANESILVIEDTPEIRLEHPHVRYVTTRESNSDGAGRITPAQCIRAGMRMAMNRIIFGEMRDAEAAEAFIDVCASGHPGLSTIHARSGTEALVRLELFLGRSQKGVGRAVIQQQIATAVQVIAHVDVCHQTGKRRIFEITEIGEAADNCLRRRELFRYTATNGIPSWSLKNRVSYYKDDLENGEKGQLPAVSLPSMPNSILLSNANSNQAGAYYQ